MSSKKVWFITGSSTGFGRELAEELLEQGFRVVATARKPEALNDLAEKYPETVRAVKLDVTNPEEVRAAIAGDQRIRAALTCLSTTRAMARSGRSKNSKMSKSVVNLKRIFSARSISSGPLCLLYASKKAGISLIFRPLGGFVSFPSAGLYCASKFALEAMTEALSGELAMHGIKATIIEPGAFRTEFNGSALDIAKKSSRGFTRPRSNLPAG